MITAPIQPAKDFKSFMGDSGDIGDCQTCVNYEPQYRHCALLDIWFDSEQIETPAEEEGACQYYQPDPVNN